MALIAMSPWLTCYQLRTMRRFSRITAPATSPQTKRIQRSVRPTRIRHQLPHRLSRTEMIATDLRRNPPHNAMLVAAILGTDLYSFVQASFAIVSVGGRFLPNWHIEAICHDLSHVWRGETRRLIITVPPRSLKSICASVCLPAFVLGHDPARRIICVSYSEGLARKHANDCRALMRSNFYRGVFPATRISPSKDTETEVMTTVRGSRLATSVGGTLTGRGGHLRIIDEPLKPQEGRSQKAPASLKQCNFNTL